MTANSHGGVVKSFTIWWRTLVAATGIVLFAMWASVQWSYHEGVLAWRDARQSLTTRAFMAADIPPATPGQAFLLVRLQEQRLFPPPYDVMARTLAEWMPRDPMRAGAWIQLARVRFFQGRPEEARAALLRSDALDPQFPHQRLESIQIWALLGEADRAKNLTASIVRFGGPFREAAAGQLLQAGVSSPDEILPLVIEDGMSGTEWRDVLLRLGGNSARNWTALLEKVPGEVLTGAEFGAGIEQRVVSAGAYDAALSIWRRRGRGMESFELSESDGEVLWLENPSLVRPPFEETGYLGWQPPPAASRFDYSWVPSQPNQEGGMIQLSYTESTRSRVDHAWRFHRLMVPPLADGCIFEAEVRLVPAIRSVCRLSLEAEGGIIRGEPSVGEEDWQLLRVVLPGADHAREVFLRLERRSQGEAYAPAQVQLGRLRVRPLQPELPEAEADK